MKTSREEALGLFRKWVNEATSLELLFAAEGVGGFISGVMADQPPGFILSQRVEGREVTQIFISLDRALEFEFQDVREAPPEARKALNDTDCVLLIRFTNSTLMFSAMA